MCKDVAANVAGVAHMPEVVLPIAEARGSPARARSCCSQRERTPERRETACPAAALDAVTPIGRKRPPGPHDGGRASKKRPAGTAAAVKSITRLFDGMLEAFEDFGSLPNKEGKARACHQAEVAATRQYEGILGIFRQLFVASGYDQMPVERARADDGKDYGAITFYGESPAFARVDSTVERKMAMTRKRDPLGTVKEATMVALATLASRREMCWLQGWDDEDPRGYFAPALSEEGHRLRLTFVGHPEAPIPVSVMMTAMSPLAEALSTMDNQGPLRHMPRGAYDGENGVVVGGDLEFALQPLEDIETLGSEGMHTCERVPACHLQPDPRLKALLTTDKTEVLVLEAYAALAPRGVVASEQWGAIIQGELRGLLGGASRDGVPVLFHLSGFNPHMLARKVYMRDAFAGWGLRVGYLRWRTGPNAPWGREQDCRDRVCIAIQMPPDEPPACA